MGGGRAPCCDKSKVKRGPWSPAEDLKLINFIHKFGHDNWRSLPKQAGLLRCGKSCRLRWINYLRPDLKRGNFTIEEEETIIKLHQSLGNKWSKIASHFPGRTDNEIKNVWNTHLKKKLLTLKVADHDDSNIQGSSCIMSSSSSSSISGVKQIDNAEMQQEECCNKLKCHNNEQTQSPLNIEDFFDAQSSDCIFEEVNKPDMIPFESENNDFWNLLDNIGSSFELSNFNNDQEINRLLAEVDGYANENRANENRANVGFDEDVVKSGYDTESSKWFKYLETELGLEETTN